jgi:acyl dehydratase
MPIDPVAVTSAPPRTRTVSWSARDAQLYHLALGAGDPPTDPRELRYTYERDLRVLPTLGTVIGGGIGFQLLDMPGVDINPVLVLHGGHEVIAHRPLPAGAADLTETLRVVAVHDKGKAAVAVLESELSDAGGVLFTQRASLFLRGEGGFGGDRGPSDRIEVPDREPDTVVEVRTLPQQAQLYRLCGDLNPLHIDPEFAAMAGFERPILHGLCSYGVAAKAAVDALLDGDAHRMTGLRARFAGVFFPGETMRVRLWRQDGALRLLATSADRDDAPVISDAVLSYQD